MIKFKNDIIEKIKATDPKFSHNILRRIKLNKNVSTITIEKICELLECQPCDVIEYHKN